MVNVTAADLMAQIISEMEAEQPRPDEFSVNEFARTAGLTIKNANYKLECLVQSGKLKRRKGAAHGRAVWLYSAADHHSGL